MGLIAGWAMTEFIGSDLTYRMHQLMGILVDLLYQGSGAVRRGMAMNRPINTWLLIQAMMDVAKKEHPDAVHLKKPFMAYPKTGLCFFYNDKTGSTHTVSQKTILEMPEYANIFKSL
jgi:hypothetical protein